MSTPKVTLICKKLTPGFLPAILLDENDDFLNDAKAAFRADVNQEQLLVRKLLATLALQLFRSYRCHVLAYSRYLQMQIRFKDYSSGKKQDI